MLFVQSRSCRNISFLSSFFPFSLEAVQFAIAEKWVRNIHSVGCFFSFFGGISGPYRLVLNFVDILQILLQKNWPGYLLIKKKKHKIELPIVSYFYFDRPLILLNIDSLSIFIFYFYLLCLSIIVPICINNLCVSVQIIFSFSCSIKEWWFNS